MGSKQSKKCEQNPGNSVVLGAGSKSKVCLAIHARDQKYVDKPADAQQTECEEPDSAGYRFSIVETMASGETEDPQDVADGFAVGIAVGHKFFSFLGRILYDELENYASFDSSSRTQILS